MLAVYPLVTRMPLPAAAAGQLVAALAGVASARRGCAHSLAGCPAAAGWYAQSAAALDGWAAAALPLGSSPLPLSGWSHCPAAACWAVTLFIHLFACGVLSLGRSYACERQRREAFAAARGAGEAALELRWRRVPAWRAALQQALAGCVLWQVLAAVSWPLNNRMTGH